MGQRISTAQPIGTRQEVEGAIDGAKALRQADRNPQRERELCTCGLVAAGYRAGWAVSHATKCPAAALFR